MKTKKKAMKAIGRYLQLKGCDVLEESWQHGEDRVDYIVDDDGAVAFVFGSVSDNCGAGIPNRLVDRKEFERLVAAYFTEHPELADCEVRADLASILVLSSDRAIIRHHVNALSACGLDLHL